MVVNYFFSGAGYAGIRLSPEKASILWQVYTYNYLRQLPKSVGYVLHCILQNTTCERNSLMKGDLFCFSLTSVFTFFHRPAENPSAVHRIKGTLFHRIPAVWVGYWFHWLVSQCLFHSGSMFPLRRHVQHAVHSAIPPHRRVSQGRRGEFSVWGL